MARCVVRYNPPMDDEGLMVYELNQPVGQIVVADIQYVTQADFDWVPPPPAECTWGKRGGVYVYEWLP